MKPALVLNPALFARPFKQPSMRVRNDVLVAFGWLVPDGTKVWVPSMQNPMDMQRSSSTDIH